MPRKSNEKRPVVAVVGRPPRLGIVFDDDAVDDDGDEIIDEGDAQRSVVAVVQPQLHTYLTVSQT